MKKEIIETQHKIKESEYFLKKIQELERYGDDDEFDYNFNAFLHSWASIFDMMLEDYQRAFGLKISMLDDLNTKNFREKADGNKKALDFVDEYDKEMIVFFGHRHHARVLDLLESPMRFDEFITFLLNRIDWKFFEYGYHNCYIALYNVIQDILGWNLDYHHLITNPTILGRQQLGFDTRFITKIFSENNFKGLNMNLDEIFQQNFLRQQVIKKQEQRYMMDKEGFEKISKSIKNTRIQTPIYPIAGLMKKKRHSRTHRKGKESMMTIQNFAGEELTNKSRYLNFLRENYVNEEQGMIFGHFNTPIGVIDTCEQMLDKTKQFVQKFTNNYPIENN